MPCLSYNQIMSIPRRLLSLQRRLLPIEHDDLADAEDGTAPRRASVLILLHPVQSEPYFVLTLRPPTLARHPGQIALPGGVAEPHDQSPWHTAVRETEEEIGLRSDRLQSLGRLPRFHVQVSNYSIAPFVAWNPVTPWLHPDPREVAEMFHVPLSILTDSGAVEVETWDLRGQLYQVTFYRFGDHRIWGATARILNDLAERLEPLRPRPSQPPGSVVPA